MFRLQKCHQRKDKSFQDKARRYIQFLFFSASGSKTKNGKNPFKLSGSFFFILYVYNIISVCFCIVVCKRLHALCIDYLTFRVTPAWYVYSRMTISEHKLLQRYSFLCSVQYVLCRYVCGLAGNYLWHFDIFHVLLKKSMQFVSISGLHRFLCII